MGISDELRKMSEIDQFRSKPDPRPNLSGKIFASGNSPEYIDSKYVLFGKPDNREKTGFGSPGHKNYSKIPAVCTNHFLAF